MELYQFISIAAMILLYIWRAGASQQRLSSNVEAIKDLLERSEKRVDRIEVTQGEHTGQLGNHEGRITSLEGKRQ